MIEICPKIDCVGCGACLSACNHAAILMIPDKLGFLYPVINQEKCIDCGLCAKSCFNNENAEYREPISTCVGHAVDKNEQLSSTSGGLASVFIRTILENRGIVYACSGTNAKDVKHIRVDRLEDINKLKGSKYVQSYMDKTCKFVVQDLKDDKKVLFVGTPCQVAGLKAYLKGKVYPNLFTVDFVCHGVPSQHILNSAIESKLKYSDGLTLVNRVKEKGKESKYSLRLIQSEKIVYDQTYPSLGYITGFLSGLFYRENCYRCKFAKRERISDITLGDFWDRNNNVMNLPNKADGLSMIMVNSENGCKLMNDSKDSYISVNWNYEDFIKRNGQLQKSISRHAKRDQFEELFCSKGFEYALNITLTSTLRSIKKRVFFNEVASLLSYVPYLRKIYNKVKNR